MRIIGALKILGVFWRMHRRKPAFLSFNVTNKCNERCLMCSVWRIAARELSLYEIEKLFIGLRRHGIKVVEITGGEPFARKDTPEILRMLGRIGFLLTITTNGTMLSGALIEKLNALKGLVQVAVSIDSLDRGRYAAIRGADMLPAVLGNLTSVKPDNLSFPLKVNFTVSRLNYRETSTMLDFVKRNGMFLSVFPATRGSGFYHRGDDPSLEPDEAERREMAGVFSTLSRLRKAGEPLWEYSRFYDLAAEYVLGKPVGMCDAGTLYLDLHADGTLAACADQSGLGSLLDEDILEVLGRIPSQSERLQTCAERSPCCYTCTFNLSITADHIADFIVESLKVRANFLIRRFGAKRMRVDDIRPDIGK